MSRAIKGLIARALTAALLFMQFAVAAYACPNLGSPPGQGWAPELVAPQPFGENIERCARPDPADPHRCLQHCQQGGQASTESSAPPAFPVVVFPLLAVVPVHAALASCEQPEFLVRAVAPPASIRFCVLRT